MNTPTHLLVNLALLHRRAPTGCGRWIAAGALLPDVPMLLFYAWQRWGVGAAEREIWGSHYYEASWQQLFDAFNSAPLFAGIGLAAWAAGRRAPAWLCASAMLHFLGDALLHREDGHRHLWPLSDWRFMSPVSYWDPAHHGALAAAVETAVLITAAWVLGREARTSARLGLAAGVGIAIAGWLGFYAWG